MVRERGAQQARSAGRDALLGHAAAATEGALTLPPGFDPRPSRQFHPLHPRHELGVKAPYSHPKTMSGRSAVHKEAHGLVADEIVEVQEGA
jgi:hypothetical protein